MRRQLRGQRRTLEILDAAAVVGRVGVGRAIAAQVVSPGSLCHLFRRKGLR